MGEAKRGGESHSQSEGEFHKERETEREDKKNKSN